jgi:hypothetical protein
MIIPHSKECKGHVPNYKKFIIAHVWSNNWQIETKLPKWITKMKIMDEGMENIINRVALTSIGGIQILNIFKVNEMDYKNGQILSFYGSPSPSAEGIVLNGLRSGNGNGNVFGEFDKTDNFLNIY